MKYKVGDKVRIVSEKAGGFASNGMMDKYLGTIMTIKYNLGSYTMEEDNGLWPWSYFMIKGLVADELPSIWGVLDKRWVVIELTDHPDIGIRAFNVFSVVYSPGINILQLDKVLDMSKYKETFDYTPARDGCTMITRPGVVAEPTEKPALKTCPFCGEVPDLDDFGLFSEVCCTNGECGLDGISFSVEEWNKRSNNDK